MLVGVVVVDEEVRLLLPDLVAVAVLAGRIRNDFSKPLV